MTTHELAYRLALRALASHDYDTDPAFRAATDAVLKRTQVPEFLLTPEERC